MKSTAKTLATEELRWHITDVPPPRDAFVTAVYCGLVEFSFSEGFVDVAFHIGDGRHNLEIQIYQNPPNPPVGCKPDCTIPADKKDIFKLEVPAQSGSMPDVFEMPGAFDRSRTGKDYDSDFRWLPDLHSLDFYPEGYDLKAVQGPRLEVHNGTFYTRMRSNSTFNLVDVDRMNCNLEGRYFGHVALCMATAINAQSDVLLKLNDKSEPEYTFAWKAGDKYQIVFRNECDSSCDEPQTGSCDEKKRNDFHFSRNILKVPQERVKYGLKLKDGCGEACAETDFCIKTHRHPRFTDEAPCMGAGYGKATGFP